MSILLAFPLVGWMQDSSQNDERQFCIPYPVEVAGIFDVKQGQAHTYTLDWSDTYPEASTTFELWEGTQLISSSSGNIFQAQFPDQGRYSLKIVVTTKKECISSSEIAINVYTSVYTYVGPGIDELQLAAEGSTNSGMYVKELLIDDILGGQNEQFTSLLADQVYYLQHADVILLDNDVVSPFFEVLANLQQLVNLDISNSDIYVLASINQSAFRRMLSRYGNSLGIEKIHVVGKEYVGSLVTSLFLGKNMENLGFVKTYAVSLAYSNKRLIVSYIVDYLLQQGFPLGTLLLILMLPLLVVIITVCRQIIGMSVFGVFNPLLFAFSGYVIGIVPTMMFLVASFIATGLVKLFTKKVYLLYSAKISLLIVLYSLISLVFLFVVNHVYPGWISYELFDTIYILFPFLFIVIVGNRVFSEKFYLFDKGRWIGLLEFFVVSGVIYFVLHSSWTQNLLLGYPELALLCTFLIVLVGRFTGLQVLEYIRFMPLIMHYFEEEE